MKKKMEKSGLTWSLLLLLVCIDQSLQQPCEYTGLDCDFNKRNADECEFTCPSFLADSRFDITIWPRKVAKIQCNLDPPWSDFKLNSTGEVEDVEEVRIQYCSLPDVPLHEITQRLGVQPIQKLKFESYKNLSSILKRRHLSGFPKIEELSLHSNYLRRVPDDLLDDFPELIALGLRENELEDLPENFFRNLSKLQVLELGNNKMTHISPSLFSGLNDLTFLNLWSNQLTEIEAHTFAGLTALKSLGLQTNKLTTIHPEGFKPLINLNELSISGNYFTSLPEDLLSENRNLKMFTLKYNRVDLTTLPNRFLSSLPRLEEVYLGYNKLTRLPEDLLSNSTSIKILDLSHNSLSTLPKSIFKDAINLTSLNLSWNKITSLPGRIFQSMAKLQKMELQNNNIFQITQDLFSGLNALEDLNLESNGMRIIEPNSFDPLMSLKFARLSLNNITLNDNLSAAEASPFEKCENLVELHLANNSITQIFQDWCTILPKLRMIDLKYNQISKIDTFDLNFIPNHVTVDIRHNNIKEINLVWAESLVDDPKIKLAADRTVIISVDENPIVCDCGLNSFLKYLNGQMHPNVQKLFHIKPDQLKCSGPQFMAGTRVSDLKYKSFECYKGTCGEKCDCWLRENANTIIANCSHRLLREAPERFNLEGYNVELDLSGNLLTEMPSVNKLGYGNVTALLLSHNNISSFSANAVPPTLKVLELDGNNMKRMNTTALEIVEKSTPLQRLTLDRNPWTCDCEANGFRKFIQENGRKLPEILNTSCGDETHKGKKFSTLTADELCPSATREIIVGSLIVAAIGLLIGVVATFCCKYQFQIEIWLYNHPMFGKLFAEETVDKNKMYDAFVSHAHQDQKFVDEELIPKLENGADEFKLCVHYRDWNVGEVIPEQIARSVEESRRTILVVSPDFIKSMWGKLEFQAAHRQALNDRRRRVIIIIYGEIGPTDKLDEELRAYLKMNTYVKWGDPWFWEKLIYAMPHRGRGKPRGENARRGRSQREKNILRNHQQLLQLNPDRNGLVSSPGAPDTPPPLTTPPANSLNTFMSNDSAKSEVVITDSLKKEMANINAFNSPMDLSRKSQRSERKITDGKDTILLNHVNALA
ncbi:protein toll [Neodiprion virginianus]|uniref:protein toll n=1 Tax=Neodiprion virginianus TaxID=2961670 RepID=UPI001EE7087C|nr:protein toll [Neodiprion virginianus]